MITKNTSQKAFNWPVMKLRLKKYASWLYAFAAIAAIFLIYMKYYHTYSEGYKEGYLQKFSEKGNLFKTFEGELTLIDPTLKTIALTHAKFTFSVTSNQLARHLDTLQNKLLLVHYREKNGTLVWRGESEFIVDSVKVRQ